MSIETRDAAMRYNVTGITINRKDFTPEYIESKTKDFLFCPFHGVMHSIHDFSAQQRLQRPASRFCLGMSNSTQRSTAVAANRIHSVIKDVGNIRKMAHILKHTVVDLPNNEHDAAHGQIGRLARRSGQSSSDGGAVAASREPTRSPAPRMTNKVTGKRPRAPDRPIELRKTADGLIKAEMKEEELHKFVMDSLPNLNYHDEYLIEDGVQIQRGDRASLWNKDDYPELSSNTWVSALDDVCAAVELAIPCLSCVLIITRHGHRACPPKLAWRGPCWTSTSSPLRLRSTRRKTSAHGNARSLSR